MAKSLPKIEGLEKATLLRVPPSALVINDDHNSRIKATVDIKGLMDDLIAAGRQLQPIGLYALPEGNYEVAYGARRVRAITELVNTGAVPDGHPLTKVEGVVIPRGSDVEVYEANIRENNARVNLSPLEEAAALDALVNFHGKSLTDAAKVFGKSKGWASQRIALTTLGSEAKKMIEKGILTASDGYELSKMSEEDQVTAISAIQEGLKGKKEDAKKGKGAEGSKAVKDAKDAAAEKKGKKVTEFDRHSFAEEILTRKAQIEESLDGTPIENDTFGVQWEILDLIHQRMELKVSSKSFFKKLNELIPA